MKKREPNGFTSLISMLSLFAAFFAICAACIYTLIRLDIMNVDWIYKSGTEPHSTVSPVSDGNGVFGKYSELEFEDGLREILLGMPFYDSFYARMYATYIGSYGENGSFKIESYNVYKSGDKYKIQTYDNHMNLVKTVICDGEHVSVWEADTDTEKIFPVSELFDFMSVSPIPDFSIFKTEKYELYDYYFEDGEYVFSCVFPDMGITDEIHISAEYGIPMSFVSRFGGEKFVEYSIERLNTEYVFSETEFLITSE